MNSTKSKSLLRLFLFGNLLLAVIACKQKNSEIDKGINFLVIIADDAGWNDVGYNGSAIKTPTIDLLGSQGVILNRFYVAPTCSPTRAALLTGMPASRIGIVQPIGGRSELTLPDSITTLPQALKRQGYQTALIGKWHLGLDIANGPNAFGFDYSYGFLHGQIDQYRHVYKNGDKSWYRNSSMLEEEGHATDLISKEAIEWLSHKRDPSKNFYLQLAYSAPHFPLQEEQKWKEPYMESIQDSSRRDFAAAMSHLDFAIGEVLALLSRSNLDENTVVIFMSDNGAQENWYPKNEYNNEHGPNPVLGSNKPLRDFKKSNYEGGIRVPAIIYWNGHLPAGKNDNFISVYDLMPTLLTLAGTAIPQNVEGKNVWPTIVNAEDKTSHEIYTRGSVHESLIRSPWKIIRERKDNISPSDFQLYNILEDPEERENLIDIDSKITTQMKESLHRQFMKDAKFVNDGTMD